jgi:hypothetical protein
MNSKKRLKIILSLVLIFIFAVIVYAQVASVAGAANQAGTAGFKGTKDNTDIFVVLGQTDKPDPKPDKTLQAEFDNLIEHVKKANEEREGSSKKVSENTRKESIGIADKINSILSDFAKKSREKGFENAAKLYEYSGESTVFQTNVYMKDEIKKEDFAKLEERSKTEGQLLDAAYKEVDPSSLSPAQREYLKNVSLKNLKENLLTVKNIIAELKLVMDDLNKSKDNLSFIEKAKKLPKLVADLALAKSIMGFLKTLMQSIQGSINNLMILLKM